MVENIVLWLTHLIEQAGYLGVALSMFIESFFVPIPSELIMPFAGFVASEGRLNLGLLIIVGGLSSYLGSLPFYFIGYWGNKLIVDKFLKQYGKYLFLTEKDVQKGFEVFESKGSIIVLLGRIIPVIRSVISFPAGVAKMPFISFSIFTIVGSLLWTAILAILGYILGANWEVVGDYVARYEHLVIYALIAIGVFYMVSRLIRTKQ
ncbi:DedA family protein [bacterium]|nr:DedA family protein [bacterium]